MMAKKYGIKTGILIMVMTAFLLGTLYAEQLSKPEIYFYDAGRDGLSPLNSPTSYRKEGNLVPSYKLVKKDDVSWAEFSYKGSAYAARTIIFSKKDTPLETNRHYTGVKLTIYYEGNDFAKLLVKMRPDKNKKSVVKMITLSKGVHEYPITSDSISVATWSQLPYVRFDMGAAKDGKHPRFLLKNIVMVEKKEPVLTGDIIHLKVGGKRKVHEVLPVTQPIVIDGNFDTKAWNKVKDLKGFFYLKSKKAIHTAQSPLRVKLAFDEKYLYLETCAQFPTPPAAHVAKHDGQVWEDEALEIFFVPHAEEQGAIQYVVNQKGVVFDQRKVYGEAAIAGYRAIEWNMQGHSQTFKEHDGVWTSEFAFPFKHLGADLSKSRIMEFQIAQDYASDRKQTELKSLTWNNTRKLPKREGFGILVLNNKPFGAGHLNVKAIRRIGSGSSAAFEFDCDLTDLPFGVYTVKKKVMDPQYGVVEDEEKLEIPSTGDTISRTFKVNSGKNHNGRYTIYLSILNQAGDELVSVTDFFNHLKSRSQFGERIFSPVPKKIVWGKGHFMAATASKLYIDAAASKRTRKTAGIFVDDYYGYTGRRLSIIKKKDLNNESGIVLKLAEKSQNLHLEGYRLEVSKDRVVITGDDEPGLYYGTVTFFQLLRNGMKIEKGRPVPSVTITDWPDSSTRLIGLWPVHHIRANREFKDPVTLENLLDWVERYVAGQKCNQFQFNFGAVVQYKRRPEFNKGKPYTLEDMAQLSRYCRDRFIEPVPGTNLASHSLHWLLPYHPELREKGFKQQADVTHPEHDNIVYDCMLDVIEVMKPKYFNIWSDEWWHKKPTGSRQSEVRSKLLSGKDRRTVFFEHHLKLHKWLKKRGIRMIAYHDMFTPYHNGKRYDIFKKIHTLPKDIIFQFWSPNRKPEYLRDRGFEVWSQANTATMETKSRKEFSGFGKLYYSYGAYPSRLYPKTVKYSEYYSPVAGARMADFAWNSKTDTGETLPNQVDSGRTAAVSAIMAISKNPRASHKVRPILFQEQMNADFGKFVKSAAPTQQAVKEGSLFNIPSGEVTIGQIPMVLEKTPGNNCIVAGKNADPVEIQINRNCSSLVFLHALHVRKGVKGLKTVDKARDWPYGQPLGRYKVTYADGTTETIRLRNTRDMSPYDIDPQARFAFRCRYTHPIIDNEGNERFLYQLEWVNPKPDSKIAKVELIHENVLDVDLALFAVSGRDVKRND